MDAPARFVKRRRDWRRTAQSYKAKTEFQV